LVKIYTQVQRQKLSPNIDFESFFFNALQEHIHELKEKKTKSGLMEVGSLYSSKQKNIVSDCVMIIDENARKIIQARVAEGMSFEKIAEKFNYSNPVIAQFEVNKALSQLEGIVKLRLNISLN